MRKWIGNNGNCAKGAAEGQMLTEWPCQGQVSRTHTTKALRAGVFCQLSGLSALCDEGVLAITRPARSLPSPPSFCHPFRWLSGQHLLSEIPGMCAKCGVTWILRSSWEQSRPGLWDLFFPCQCVWSSFHSELGPVTVGRLLLLHCLMSCMCDRPPEPEGQDANQRAPQSFN